MKYARNLYEKNLSFFRFLIVGVFASIVNLLCFLIFFYILNVFEILTYSISYIVGVASGYFFNKKWAFNYKKSSKNTLFSKYLLVYIINLFIGMGFFELVLILFRINELLVQFIVIIITAISNFLGLKIFVFK